MTIKASPTSQAPAPAAAVVPATKAPDRFEQALAARQERTARTATRSEAPRSRAEDLGGLRLKLAVDGEIPGHHLYWENDENGRIEQLLYEGFDFVTPGEVRRASDLVADMDTANRISRYVGTRADGGPLRAYLLKCPEAIWQRRQDASLQQANRWDAEIRQGRMKPQSSSEYVPAGYSSRLETNVEV